MRIALLGLSLGGLRIILKGRVGEVVYRSWFRSGELLVMAWLFLDLIAADIRSLYGFTLVLSLLGLIRREVAEMVVKLAVIASS